MKRRSFLGKFGACFGGLLGLVGIGKVAAGQKVSLALSKGKALTAIKLSDNYTKPFRNSIIWEEPVGEDGLMDATGVGKIWTTKQIDKHIGTKYCPMDVKWLRRIPEVRDFKYKGKVLVKHEWIELKHPDYRIFPEYKPKGAIHA